MIPNSDFFSDPSSGQSNPEDALESSQPLPTSDEFASLHFSPNAGSERFDLMTVEQVQKTLNRSRASVYRYANTDPVDLDPPIDPKRLNPEPRKRKEEPLLFAPTEVERFARDILGIRGVTIQVQESSESATQKTLGAILQELRGIRNLLEQQQSK